MAILLLNFSPNDIAAELKERIKALASGYQVVITKQREEIEHYLDEIEIAVGNFPIDFIPRTKHLRWYQQWGAGTDWLMRHPEIKQMDFILTNASGVHAIPISEHILALMLALSRRIPQAIREQSRRNWSEINQTDELAGKTVVVIGVGAIGKQTAKITSSLGMNVIGIRRHPGRPLPGMRMIAGQDQLLEILPLADYIVLTIPLTNETRHIINSQAFSVMKPSAYMINIGRGGTIDELAMIQALLNGEIAGAGLDVFEVEPLPKDSPLWEMDNVIITAHYSGNTPYYDQRANEIFLDNLERYIKGKPMRNVVDKTRGY